MTTPTELLDRRPPSDPQAERWILGSMILRPSVIDELGSTLRASDFSVDANQRIYTALLDMRDRRAAIDIGLLERRLKATGQHEVIGGTAYLAELMEVPHTRHASYYAKIVREKAAKRAVIQAGLDMIQDGYTSEDTPTEILGRCETALGRIETGDYTGDPKPLSQSLTAAILRAEAIREKSQAAGLMTGLYSFDSRIGGLFPGELVVLAARPRIGKTALACQIAMHAALGGHLAYFASLEMSDVELTTRMLCSRSGVNSKRIRTGTIDAGECRRLAEHSETMAVGKMLIHDRPGMSVNDIRRACRRLKGLSLVVVDYLQRVTPSDRRANRYEQIADIVKGLKTLARELSVPVLCLAQLGRDADKTGKPELYHLRESGDIEAEADVVAFLVRNVQWEEHDEPSPEKAALIIEKNRNGETGTVRLEWEAERTRFHDHDESNYEPAFAGHDGSF